MNNKPVNQAIKPKVKFIVSREFIGQQSMRDAFEQVVERKAHTHFEAWKQKKSNIGHCKVSREMVL